jgi:hypothetical protein
VPEVPVVNEWEADHPVILMHLLEHTAGFRDIYLRDFIIPEGTPLPGIREAVSREPDYFTCRWKPGTRNAYSNPGYTLLGYIIEKYSGQPYHDYLSENLFKPLEMKGTDFLGRDHGRLAFSYDRSGNRVTPLPILDHPAGYLHSTPDDMAKFIRFMLLPGSGYFKFMPEEAFRQMETPSSIAGANNKMIGYGKGLFTSVAMGNTGVGHDGGIDEYLSSFVCFRDKGVAYYFTITRMNGNASSELSSYLQDLLLTAVEPASENRPEDISVSIEGWYIPKSYRFRIAKLAHDLFDPVRLAVKDDTLRLKGITGPERKLISLDEGYFRAEESPLPTHYIGEYENTIVISSSFSDGYYEKTSAFAAQWKTWGFIVSLITFILTSLIYLVNYIQVKVKKSAINAWPMLWPAAGLVSFILTLVFFSRMTSVTLLGTVNVYSVAVAIFSGLFALFFAIGVNSTRYGKTHIAIWKRVPLISGYIAWGYMVLLFALYGHMPLTTWIW